MLALHFGPSSRPLYGAYDPGAQPRRRRAVLILNPWGWEAIRAHRTLRFLATRLAAGGIDAFRFDYSGTGDSLGDLEDATAEDWLDDAEHALDELLAMASVPRASIVGLRFGGLLAAQLAERRSREVDRLVMWEPPASGSDFLAWTREAPPAEAVAFQVPSTFEREATQLRLSPLKSFRGDALIVSSTGMSPRIEGARTVHRALSPTDLAPCWVEDARNGAGVVPVTLVDQIRDWLSA